MRERHLELLACPDCSRDLLLKEVCRRDGDRIEIGVLGCSTCSKSYPIVAFIPRFVPAENYARNFGYQWLRYAETQYDSHLGYPMSERRFVQATNWPRNLEGQYILEAGCGAGRFSEIALRSGATLVAFDFSAAVEANHRMNGSNPKLLVAQGDIFSPPVKPGIFDRAFGMGVLQHTPDPERAFRSLPRFLKPGGSIAVDIYRKEGVWNWLTSYRRVRWLTRYLPVETVHSLSKIYVDLVWPLTKWLWTYGRAGRRIARYALLMKDRFWRKGFDASDELQKEWLVLHLIDQLSAYHDKPQSLATLRRWFETEGIGEIETFEGGNGVVARGHTAA